MGRTFLQGQTVQWVPNENPGAHWRPNTADPEAVAIPNHHTNDDDNIRNNDTETTKKSRKKRIAWFVLVLVIIYAVVMVWMFGFKKNDDDDSTGNQGRPIRDPVDDPATTSQPVPSAAPSTSLPPMTPFFENLLFQPPSKSDCNAISRNQTIAGREEMNFAQFGIGLEVFLADGMTMTDEILQEFLDAIQEKIIPSIAGCNILADQFVEAWRFVILDAFVTGEVLPNEKCTVEHLATQNCYAIPVHLSVFLKGFVRILDVIRLISDEEMNFSNHLDLSDSFSMVQLVVIIHLSPTPSPTSSPSSSWFLFEPPSESDCDAIAKNETIAGREEQQGIKFALDFEVVLMDNNTMTAELVNLFLESIQEKMLPSLAGCDIFPENFFEDWRFVIFDAFVTGNLLPDEACTDNIFSSQNCFRVSLQLNLFLKGSVRLLDIVGLISDKQVILSVDTLGLSGPFSALRLIRLEPKV